MPQPSLASSDPSSKSSAVVAPNLGLRYDKPPIALDGRELQDGLNFRIKEGKLSNLNLGWDQFGTFTLNGPVVVISNFAIRGGSEQLILATPTDLYVYDAGDEDVVFITPSYVTGTVTATGGGAVSTAGGTNLGDMTGDAGLAAAFDTTTNQATAACATKASATSAYAGKTLASPSAIGGAIIHGSNNNGYVSGANPVIVATLYGKTGTAPASATDGTVIGTLSFTDTANESTGRNIISTDITTVWTHVWVNIAQAGAAATMSLAELLLKNTAGTAVTGSGSTWTTDGIKAGDFIAFGSTTANDPAGAWSEIGVVGGETTLTLVAPSAYAIAGTAYTIRRTFTGDATDVWTYDSFLGTAGDDDLWLGSNGVDALVTWNGTDDFATLQDDFGITKIKSICVFSNMVIYGNFEQDGDLLSSSIVNSDAGDPLNISSGISEQFKVHSKADGINAMYTLGDNLVLYSPRVIVIAQFVGDPFIFQFRTATSGTGPLSPNVVADYGDRHVFLGFDTMYDFDGVTLGETGEHVFREVIRRNDPIRRHFDYAHFDEENGDLIWVVAQTSDTGSGVETATAEQAYVQHYLEEVPDGFGYPCSRREAPFICSGYYFRQAGLTWDEISETWEQLNFRWNDQFFASAFPLNLFGSTDGKIYTLNTSQNKGDGSGFNSFVRFSRKATGDGRMRGLIKRVYPFVERFTTDLQVTLYCADHAMGPATISNTSVFPQTLDEGIHFVSPFRRGRFFWIEFGTNGVSLPWSLAGFDVDVVAGGLR